MRAYTEHRVIEATNGGQIVVDADDYAWLSSFKWRLDRDGYAVRAKNTIKMHRELMGLVKGDGKQVDHINGDKADNRRENLRICNNVENHWNVGRQSNNSSGFKGVEWVKSRNRWRARVSVAGKRVSIGYFKTLKEALTAYETYVKTAHGAFANTGI